MAGLSLAARLKAGPERLELLDPRARLLGTALAVILVLGLHELPLLLAVTMAALLLALAFGPGVRALAHRLLHMEGFMLVLFAFLPFSVPGTPLFGAPPLVASVEGVHHAFEILLKVNACALFTFAFLAGLEPVRLGQAALGLKVPERLVQLFFLMVRYGAVLRAEATRLNEAMRARAFVPRSNLHTWRSYGHLFGMLLVRALERAERVEEAMRCRGYDGHLPAPAAPLAFRRADAVFLTVIAAGLLLPLALEHLP